MAKDYAEVDAKYGTNTVAGVTDAAAIGVGDIETVQQARAVSPDLVVNDVDRVLVKIRPQSNPLTAIALRAQSSTTKTQAFKYYEQDTLPIETSVKTAISAGTEVAELECRDNKIFSKYETLIFPDVKGYDELGKETPHAPLMAYVIEANGGKVKITAVNGTVDAGGSVKFPEVPADSKVIRAGRAHNETDIQTSPYAVYPRPKEQNTQKFKAQVEESTAMKIANKEVNFTMSDMEEDALFDMMRGMSVSFYVGSKRLIYDENKKEVYTTGGIWPQAGKDVIVGSATSDKITAEDFVNLFKEAFVGSNGSKRKTMFCGSEFMSDLSLLQLGNEVNVTPSTRFDLTFQTMSTNFGSFDVIYDESLDVIGKSKCAFVVDEDFLRRKDFAGVSESQNLDLRSSGQRDVDAKVLTRCTALYLQNPNAHMRVIPFSMK